jgi:DNA-binding IclR family transcriptional regulator
MARDHYIELVGKIVRIVETLRGEPTGLSLQELSSRTAYVKSSVHRILHSLKRHGYIEQEKFGGKYRLGIEFLVLAKGLAARFELAELSQGYLRDLVETLDESAYLAMLRGGRAIFVDVHEAQRDFRLIGPLGAEVHYHATAAGKAIAAFFPEERRDSILKSMKFPAPTSRTMTDPSRVEKDWAEVRRRGFAINDEETIRGAVFLAAPLFDSRESVCGSITVGIPKARLTARVEKKIVDHVKEACSRLSAELRATGYVHVGGN